MRRLIWLLSAGWLVCEGAVPQPPGWKVLLADDFETGDARNWITEHFPGEGPGWQVERQGNNFVFAGKKGTAAVEGSWWFDYRVKLRFNPARGGLVMNFRARTCRNYLVASGPDSVVLMRQLACGVHTNLARAFQQLASANWYTLEAVASGPSIKVYLDGVLKIDFNDPDPLLFGGVSLEAWPDTLVYVDDFEITGPPSNEGLTWVKTGGPLGGVGYDVRMRPDNPDVMLVTDTFSGVNMSVDGGRNWFASNIGINARVGPSGDAIPIFCLTIDPHNPDVVWVGTQGTRSLFKSTDGGKTWLQKDRGIAEAVGTAFRGITVDPRNSTVLYAAAEVPAEQGGLTTGAGHQIVSGVVYRSVDGGESWSPVWRGNNLARYVWVDPRDSNLIYISTGIFDRTARDFDLPRRYSGGHGIVKSTDGGRTWRDLNEKNGLLNRYVGSLFMHPLNPDILLAGAGSNPFSENSGVYLSTDGGERWEQTLRAMEVSQAEWDAITSVEFALSDPRVAYAASARGFYRSADGGRTWQVKAGGSREQAFYGPPGTRVGFPIDLQVDPRNPDRVFINNYRGGNFLSEDGGRTWSVASQGYTGAQSDDVVIVPGDPRRLVTIGKSGIFRSDDGGESWEGLHYAPLALDPWSALALDPRDSQRLLLAEEHNGGLYVSSNGGRAWRQVFHHPSANYSTGSPHGFGTLAFAPSNPKVVYAGMRRPSGVIDAGTPGGSFGVYKSTDAGETWRDANDARTAGQDINVLAADLRSEDIVYAGTLRNGVLRSLDGGRSWEPRNEGLRILDVRALAINPQNPFVIYAGIENGGVYKTTDAGGRWSQASFGMDPQAVIRDIVIDPTNPEAIYAADRRTGVYRSTDGGKSWSQVNRGLRTRAVNALAVSDDGSGVYAATEGEGIFRLDLKPQAEAMVATVSAASFVKDAPLAPESIASLFGAGLAAATQQAASVPLPPVLADASVSVTDSTGVDRWAPLFFASPGQINCQIPAGTATGTATVRVLRQNRVVARGQVRIEPVAPALFTANSDGKGAPAAVALRISADGSQTQLPVFQCGASCTPAPIDLGAESDQVILLLFGTGIRGGKSVTVHIGGVEAPVLGASAQGQFVGLDQVNVRLPRELAGRGEVDLVLTVDGKAATAVEVQVQ